MEQKETVCFNNLLLDIIELPTDITLLSSRKVVSTPSLHNKPSENLQDTKAPPSDKTSFSIIKQKFYNCNTVKPPKSGHPK